ncbi:MAG: site-specific DNA-methyltransferase [Bacilli bacterium]|nr:site-specific DNA-methyltransferase [Bacilli bacterium]
MNKNLDELQIGAPLLIQGDAFLLLKELPDQSVDLILTSPPYFGQRQIKDGPFSQVKGPNDYLRLLKRLGKEFKRVLKKEGSLWLNIGDSYRDSNLLLIPSRVAISMQDELGFILRNDVIWEKRSFLPPSIKNRTANSYEHLFHFVLDKGYYVNKMIGTKKVQHLNPDGRVVSKTGITGEDYRRKIEASSLSGRQKEEALGALARELAKVQVGEISDFRMLIRGGSSILHSQRAEELNRNGFAFLEASPNERVGDVWNIGISSEKEHDSPFPEELTTYPILSSCPKKGIVLDPFAGSGTTLVAALKLRRRAIGFEIDEDYCDLANRRIAEALSS